MTGPLTPGEAALDDPVMRHVDGDWRLTGSRCPVCTTTAYPARRLCARDQAPMDPCDLSDQGTIYEAVQVAIAPVGFDAPYWVGYVDLPEGVRVFSQILWTGEAPPGHGDAVRCRSMIVRRDPDVIGPVFEGPV